jgi:hypothetical protein
MAHCNLALHRHRTNGVVLHVRIGGRRPVVIFENDRGQSWYVCGRARYGREPQLRAPSPLCARRVRDDGPPDGDDARRRGGERRRCGDAHPPDASVTVPFVVLLHWGTLTPLIPVRIQVPQPYSAVSGRIFPGWREPSTFPRVRPSRLSLWPAISAILVLRGHV